MWDARAPAAPRPRTKGGIAVSLALCVVGPEDVVNYAEVWVPASLTPSRFGDQQARGALNDALTIFTGLDDLSSAAKASMVSDVLTDGC